MNQNCQINIRLLFPLVRDFMQSMIRTGWHRLQVQASPFESVDLKAMVFNVLDVSTGSHRRVLT